LVQAFVILGRQKDHLVPPHHRHRAVQNRKGSILSGVTRENGIGKLIGTNKNTEYNVALCDLLLKISINAKHF
jgi:hypothetical protein